MSEVDSGSELDVARISYGGGLSEGGVWSGGIGSSSPCGVGDHVVAVIERVEGFCHAFELYAIRE